MKENLKKRLDSYLSTTRDLDAEIFRLSTVFERATKRELAQLHVLLTTYGY